MAAWKKIDEMKYVGHPQTRLEALQKVTGQAKYSYDISLPGMLWGKIKRSPYPSAKIVKIDTSKAEQLPGVRVVETYTEMQIRFAGQHVAAVAATSPEIAEDAVELIDVQYEELAFVVSEDEAIKPEAPRVFGDSPNMRTPTIREEGDLKKGFEESEVVVEGDYRTQVQTHSCLETHGIVAKWEGDNLTVWASTQGVFSVRDELAQKLKLPNTQVRVITEHMGGGFGSKFGAGDYGAICASLAKKAGAPVKLMLDRAEEHTSTGNRPSSVQHIKLGAKKDGKLLAFDIKAYGTPGVGVGSRFPAPYIYKFPNFRTEMADVHINAGPSTAMRAPGHPQASFGMESIMDELAEKLGMDPLELRKANDPNPTRQKQYEVAAQKMGWSRRNLQPGTDPGPKKRGIGVGSCMWSTGGRGTKAQVIINSDGTVEVRCGTQDIGTGTRTLVAMIAAEELGLKPTEVRARIGDTDFPPSGGSGGSTTAPSVAPTIKTTSEAARTKLFELVAPKLGAVPEELVAADGKISVKSDPSRSMTWKEATRLIGPEPLLVSGEWSQGLSSSGVAGVQMAEVEVDTETGNVKMLKVVAVQDCGLVLNPLTARSQVNGAVIGGIGYALLEDRILDKSTGRMLNPNMSDYKVPGALEMPEFDVTLWEDSERGVIGIGEPPTVPTAGAIANAIHNACGVRIRELPITPAKVLKALAAKGKET